MANSAANGVRYSMFATPFTICRAVSYYFFECSLFNVRRAIRHSPFAVHHSPSHSPRHSPLFNVAMTLSIPLRVENIVFFAIRAAVSEIQLFLILNIYISIDWLLIRQSLFNRDFAERFLGAQG